MLLDSQVAVLGVAAIGPVNSIASMPEQIECVVERVTFHNAENGFSVLRVRPRGKSGAVITVVGSIAAVAEGEHLLAEGEWREDRQHGRRPCSIR